MQASDAFARTSILSNSRSNLGSQQNTHSSIAHRMTPGSVWRTLFLDVWIHGLNAVVPKQRCRSCIRTCKNCTLHGSWYDLVQNGSRMILSWCIQDSSLVSKSFGILVCLVRSISAHMRDFSSIWVVRESCMWWVAQFSNYCICTSLLLSVPSDTVPICSDICSPATVAL